MKNRAKFSPLPLDNAILQGTMSGRWGGLSGLKFPVPSAVELRITEPETSYILIFMVRGAQ